MDLVTVLQALAKLRGTSVEFETARHNAEWAEARQRQKYPMALTAEERTARLLARRTRAREKAKLKRHTDTGHAKVG